MEDMIKEDKTIFGKMYFYRGNLYFNKNIK